jgi:hypothetical protein
MYPPQHRTERTGIHHYILDIELLPPALLAMFRSETFQTSMDPPVMVLIVVLGVMAGRKTPITWELARDVVQGFASIIGSMALIVLVVMEIRIQTFSPQSVRMSLLRVIQTLISILAAMQFLEITG